MTNGALTSSRRAFLASAGGGLATTFLACATTPPPRSISLGFDPGAQYPDVRSHRQKLGLLLPATNTTMEHELWTLLVKNRDLGGIGIHSSVVVTPRPVLRTADDLESYKKQFVGGLDAAVEHALLAQPDALVMGMSLEHILHGIDAIRGASASVTTRSKIPLFTWQDAAPAALRTFGARRIGLLTPFGRTGNENATRLFRDLGFDVVTSVGFACPDAVQIAHVPDAAKERAIVELLATPDNKLDAIVQCGTNMGMIDVAEKIEPKIGIPILGINPTLLWYALRQQGIRAPLAGGGRLLREA